MRFSDRIGATQPQTLLQSKGMDERLRNQLWQICLEHSLPVGNAYNPDHFSEEYEVIFFEFFAKPEDSLPYDDESRRKLIRSWFFDAKWYDAYNLLEFLFKKSKEAQTAANRVLETNRSAYRFVAGVLIPITDEFEVGAVNEATSEINPFAGARQHILTALALFGRQPYPDYRNAIREAISAVESACKAVSGNEAADLNKALRSIESLQPMHSAFRAAIEKLYAWTNDEKGIRHALLEETASVDEADAHFMIVACAAFVNFLVQKHADTRN